MKNLRWQICTALVLVVLTMALARAAERNYNVELIVFRNVEANGDDSPALAENNVFGDTREPVPPGADFERLAAADMQLDTIVRRLQNSRLYEPVLHIAWRQPGLHPDRASAFVFAGGEGASRVDGIATLFVERYVHLNLDIALQFRGSVYRLRERRRMRSKETHFFDHPRFGVIARVTPAG